jgi:hypothetical protein
MVNPLPAGALYGQRIHFRMTPGEHVGVDLRQVDDFRLK